MDLYQKVNDILTRWRGVATSVDKLKSFDVITSVEQSDKGRLYRSNGEYYLELIFHDEDDKVYLGLGIEPMCTIAHELGHLEYYLSGGNESEVHITKEFMAWKLGRKFIESEKDEKLLNYYDSYNKSNIEQYFHQEVDTINALDIDVNTKQRACQNLKAKLQNYMDEIIDK
ncbi:hypothetical protein [Aquibacillus sediminis]|uniref:hypothetical protein n=1 Tax=Aquibacillus sediminis TaxID=2574734 RepID=UPI001107B623|nr:hypothetical protein [Aquibacillus sediminis]